MTETGRAGGARVYSTAAFRAGILADLDDPAWLQLARTRFRRRGRRVYRATARGRQALAEARPKLRELFGEIMGKD